MPITFPSDDVPLRDDHDPFSHKLRFFSSPNTGVSRFASVARYLDGIFPFLIRLVEGKGGIKLNLLSWRRVSRCAEIRRREGSKWCVFLPAETVSDEEDFVDGTEDTVGGQDWPPSEKEVAAASLIQPRI